MFIVNNKNNPKGFIVFISADFKPFLFDVLLVDNTSMVFQKHFRDLN